MAVFQLVEFDNEQSESRCTAYLSGDEKLISAVESGKDFHGMNAELFFGIPYNQVIGEFGKVLNKEIRQLSKRINHGANYNMGPAMLLQQMGEENCDKAKILLGLPRYWNRLRVCEHLLDIYAKTYPSVKGIWYTGIKNTISTTRKLVSPLGWTRYCFGNPDKNKLDLNAYVAHPPQNLSVGIINEGFKAVFWKVQVKNPHEFRLKAQIHDSILTQINPERPDIIIETQKILTRPTLVTDIKGIKRTMVIPVAIKSGKNWGEMEKWQPKTTS